VLSRAWQFVSNRLVGLVKWMYRMFLKVLYKIFRLKMTGFWDIALCSLATFRQALIFILAAMRNWKLTLWIQLYIAEKSLYEYVSANAHIRVTVLNCTSSQLWCVYKRCLNVFHESQYVPVHVVSLIVSIQRYRQRSGVWQPFTVSGW
jgi:hypothetical protein